MDPKTMDPPAAEPNQRLWTRLRHRVAIDTRALATLRIAMGALLLVDLFYRAFNLTAFYTDQGVFPRSALVELRPMFHGVSLHALGGGLGLQVALLLLLGLAALALLVGLRTRLATLVCFVLLGSLHARNPFILNSGDSLLLLLLFWGFFLPLGERWSWDARAIPAEPRQVADVASLAILLQVVLIYSMNAYFKIESGHWASGEAMQYTFSIDRFSTPLGRLLSHMPPVLVAAGWGWLGLLCVSALLILTTGRTRTVFVMLFASVHLGMFLFMRLGVFPLVSLAALVPFLPQRMWDHAQPRIERIAQRVRMFNRSGQRPAEIPGEPPGPPTLPFWSRWARTARTPAVSAFLVVILFWSGFSLGMVDLPQSLDQSLSGHERGWAMFANPSRANVWYVAPAETESGRQVDALHGPETPWDEPAHVDPLYPDIRWRKYLAEFHRIQGGDLPDHFAAYLCHKGEGEDPIERLAVYRIEQPIRLNAPDPPGTVELLVQREC